jgi:hypothetical protein
MAPGDSEATARKQPVQPQLKAGPRRAEFDKKKLDKFLELKPERPLIFWDEGSRHGLHVLVTPGRLQATVTLRVCYYLKGEKGKPRYKTLGRWPDGDYEHDGQVYLCSDIDGMRLVAQLIRRSAEKGTDPRRELPSNAFGKIVKNFIEMHTKKNRTWKETQRIFDTYVLPQWC